MPTSTRRSSRRCEWLAVTAQAVLDAMAAEERAMSSLIINLGGLYKYQGNYALAETLLTEALACCRSKLGGDHPDTLISMSWLGGLYEDQGKYAEAEALLTEALAARRKQLGDDHQDTRAQLDGLPRRAREAAGSAALAAREARVRVVKFRKALAS